MNNRDIIISNHYAGNYYKLVSIIKRRVNNNHAIAEEIVQESYTRALDFFHCFDPSIRPFDAWFRTILNNTTRDYQRKERNAGITMDVEEDDKPLNYEIMKREVEDIINKVEDEKTKEIYSLYFLKGLPPRDILQITEDTTINSIKSEVKRFRQYLEGMFSPMGTAMAGN